LHNKNADRSARLTVLSKAASELKSTIAGKLFRTFTILFAKKFLLALLVYRPTATCTVYTIQLFCGRLDFVHILLYFVNLNFITVYIEPITQL